MPLQIRSDPRFNTYLMWAKGCAAVYRFIRVSSCLRKVWACSFQPLWGPYTNTYTLACQHPPLTSARPHIQHDRKVHRSWILIYTVNTQQIQKAFAFARKV